MLSIHYRDGEIKGINYVIQLNNLIVCNIIKHVDGRKYSIFTLNHISGTNLFICVLPLDSKQMQIVLK